MELVHNPISFFAIDLCSTKIKLLASFVYIQMVIVFSYLLNLDVSKVIKFVFKCNSVLIQCPENCRKWIKNNDSSLKRITLSKASNLLNQIKVCTTDIIIWINQVWRDWIFDKIKTSKSGNLGLKQFILLRKKKLFWKHSFEAYRWIPESDLNFNHLIPVNGQLPVNIQCIVAIGIFKYSRTLS